MNMTAKLPVTTIVAQARINAEGAVRKWIAQYGNRDCCGFAWVQTNVRTNSKLGKDLLAAGFRKGYPGGLALWMPGGHITQAMSANEAGAQAAADYLTAQLNVSFFMNSRMD